MQKEHGKVVVITGASSGIGWGIARLAGRKGYRVVLSARREERLRELASKIEADGGQTLVVASDMTSLDDQQRLIDETVAKFGGLDVLVNNAGLPLPSGFSKSSPEELRRQWETNVVALSTLTRIALPHLVASRGIIVNIGSSISRFPVPGMGNYAPTKIAVAGLSDALRIELAPQGIRVCLVEPGPVTTEFSERSGNAMGTGTPFSISAGEAAAAVVRLFEHPRRRIVIPGWLGPVIGVTGLLVRAANPLVDTVLHATVGRKRKGR